MKAERALMEDPSAYITAQARLEAAKERARLDAANTFAVYAERYLMSRDLRPKTVREYRGLLDRTLVPAFGETPLKAITREGVRAWHAALPTKTPAANAAAYRLLRSVMNAAEDDELIDRSPVRIQKASTARVKNPQKPSPVDEMATIVDNMPERLRLFIVLAAFAGMREGEIFELRRSDIRSTSGSISVTRKIEKDADPQADGACPNCGRVIGPPKTEKGTRVVHLPPAFLPLLRAHLLAHTAPGADGLLFPGERKDHMSARYLLDRYAIARKAAGRSDLTIHGLRHSALTLAGQHGATGAELQARAGHASQAAMAIYQHATADRDRQLADRLGETVAASGAWAHLLVEPE
ncbi:MULTISPECIES: tyrosine-type recombinase/integrase [unclassified Nocardioides]|uniref:tyrosine-type recombinase/integrase n=1 Tax=unclassified Nocardioides TaxID=2615069 RepID=UPI0013FD8E29|nr:MULTISPECIES: site-specific integrase [unclassified Nocardioides]